MSAVGTKQCPFCAETIKAAALGCRFCGTVFPPAADSDTPPLAAGPSAPRPASTTIAEAEVPDLLASLVEKSLVLYEEDEEGRGRYRLLETVRQYSRDRLVEGAETEAVRSRHLGFFAEAAERAEPHLRSREQLEYLGRLESEHDNLRAALAWSTESELEQGAWLAAALMWFWILRSHWKEGGQWLSEFLAAAGESGDVEVRANLLVAQSFLTYVQGDLASSEVTVRAYFDLPAAAGHRTRALALSLTGVLAFIRQDREAASAAWTEGLAAAREVADPWAEAWIFMVRAVGGGLEGDEARAERDWSEGLPLAEAVGERFLIGLYMGNLADLALRREEYPRAKLLLRRGLHACLDLGHRALAAPCLELIAAAAGAAGQARLGAQLHGAAAALRETYHYPVELPDQPYYQMRVTQARADLGEAEFAAAWAEGQAMPLDGVITAAWAIISEGGAEIADAEEGLRGTEGSRRDE